MIWCTFLSILVPILIAGTIRKRTENIHHFTTYLFDICTAVIQPIQLQYEVLALKLVKKKILIRNDISMAPNLRETAMKIKCLEDQMIEHSRLQQGLETIFQVTANTILIFYAYSVTRARQGLSSLFDADANVFMGNMGALFPPQLVVAILLAINLLGFIKVQMNGMIEGYAFNYSIMGKALILLGIVCAALVRIASMTLYFSTSLGLFNLLHHYQGEK